MDAHAETLVAADLFSVDRIFFKRHYVLIYVHLPMRRVVSASCTAQPTEAWVTHQARNLSWQLQEDGIKLRVVIHDRDKTFSLHRTAVRFTGCPAEPHESGRI